MTIRLQTKVIAGVLAVLGLLAGAARAATFTVTRSDDPVPNACLVGDCSLREAVIAANNAPGADLVLLAPTDHALTRVGVGGAEIGDLDVVGTLTIRGSGGVQSLINANLLMRIFNVGNGASLILENLALRNGQPGIAEGGNGGCIEVEEASLFLGGVSIQNCVATLGGGLYARNATLTAVDTAFSGNQGSAGGGAHVRVDGGAGARMFRAENLLVLNNSSSGSGGGLYLFGAALATDISGALVIGNQAAADPTGTGGGIRIGSGGSGGGYLSLHAVWFSNNDANAGGGLFIADAVVAGERVAFAGNSAETQGGAVRLTSNVGALTLDESVAYGNTAGASGGAFRINGGSILARNTTLSGNSAPSGGALYAEFGADVTFEHATIADNDAGSNSSVARINGANTVVTWASSILSGACSIFSGNASYASIGGNLQGPGDSCGLDQATDLTNRTPLQLGLAALASNGGTQIHALSATSQARGHGLPTLCPAMDQRLAVRAGALSPPFECDSGAYEFGGVALDFLFRDDFE